MPVVSGTVARIVGRHVYLQGRAGGLYLPYGCKITVGGKARGRLSEVRPGDSARVAVKGNAPTRTVSNTAIHGDTTSVAAESADFVKNGLRG
jgi:hypothetical protein